MFVHHFSFGVFCRKGDGDWIEDVLYLPEKDGSVKGDFNNCLISLSFGLLRMDHSPL